jgi:hypothetical protein
MIRALILAVALVLASVLLPESTLADHSWICVDEFRQTTYVPQSGSDLDEIDDAYEIESAEKFNSSFQLSRPDRRIMEMMDVSMARGSLNDLLVEHERLEYTPLRGTGSDTLRLKDPNTALYYALVPGFFVHGAGHFYAGKSRTALALFGVEMLGLGFLYLGGLAGLPDGSTDNFTRQAVFLSIAAGLFLGSWYYDVMNAPQAAREHNKELQKIK